MRAAKVGVGACATIACGLAVVLGAPDAARVAGGSTAAASPIPSSARAPISAALGAGDRSFWVRELSAVNRAERLRMSFSRGGVELRTGGRFVRMSLAAFGHPGRMSPVSAAEPVVSENRIAYDRGAVREWYANGPLGLEQGFELSRAPAGMGPVVLSLALGGDLHARIDGTSVLLGGAQGLRYGDLTVTDASGRRLAASLGLSGSRLRISIDAAAARYPLHVDPVVQSAELSPPSGTGPARFGASVAVSGDTIVIGDPGYDASGDDEQFGAVFVFEQHGGSWQDASPDAVLTATDGNAPAQLGFSVAISGDTIATGAIGHDSTPGEGSVYVFVEPHGGWKTTTQTAELNANVGEAGDNIGESVGISGNTVVAGAPYLGSTTPGAGGGNGGAFVWVEPSTGWADMHAQTAILTAADGDTGDKFGWSVGISGDMIVVGAPDRTIANIDGLFEQGAAYVFDEPSGGWADIAQTAELTASDGGVDDHLGNSVAVSGETVVAGSPGHTNPNGNGYTGQGAVDVFGLPASGTVQQASQVTAPGGGAGHGYQLGSTVALAGTTLIVSEPGANDVYEFPGLAGENNDLVPSDAGTNGYYLGAVAVDGASAVIGGYNQFMSSPPGNAYAYASGGSASAPTVTTAGVGPVTSSTASLGATIDAGSTDTNYVFEYGTSSTALGSLLPAVGQFGAGSGATAIAQHPQPLTGLAAGTTYYYRACANNVETGATPVCGSLQSFKTLGSTTTPPPPKPPTGSAGKATVSGTTASVPLSCTGTGTCAVTITLSVTETLSGKKIVGVAAASTANKKPKTVKKTVTVGSESLKLAAGKRMTAKVSLNGAGRRLLTRHPKLQVKLLVTVAGKKIESSTVTFKAKKAKHKK